MSDARGFVYGMLVGTGLTFLFDPRRGSARRAMVRDRSRRAARDIESAYAIGKRDLAHRLEGAIDRLFSPPSAEVSDDILVARVRARLGHVCTHAHGISVAAGGGGVVKLSGPVLAAEHDRIVTAAAGVAGVRVIADELDVHTDHPALAPRPHADHAMLGNPSARLVLGLAAAGLALSSLLRGRTFGVLVGGAGVVAIARSITHGASSHRANGHPEAERGVVTLHP